jgi:hypothetical protein
MSNGVQAGVLLILLGLGAPSVQAQEPVDAAAVALKASDVHDEHCSNVATGKSTAAAQAIESVAPTLTEVSRAYDASQAPVLLFWRGLLYQCLDQRERALSDLGAFAERMQDDANYAAQLAEARRRLRRLGATIAPGSQSTAGPNPAGIVAGISLLGAGGAFGGLSGSQQEASQRAQEQFDAGERPWETTLGHLADAQENADRAKALLGIAAGTGVAGIVSLIVTGATTARPSVTIVAAPTLEGGVVVALGGVW